MQCYKCTATIYSRDRTDSTGGAPARRRSSAVQRPADSGPDAAKRRRRWRGAWGCGQPRNNPPTRRTHHRGEPRQANLPARRGSGKSSQTGGNAAADWGNWLLLARHLTRALASVRLSAIGDFFSSIRSGRSCPSGRKQLQEARTFVDFSEPDGRDRHRPDRGEDRRTFPCRQSHRGQRPGEDGARDSSIAPICRRIAPPIICGCLCRSRGAQANSLPRFASVVCWSRRRITSRLTAAPRPTPSASVLAASGTGIGWPLDCARSPTRWRTAPVRSGRSRETCIVAVHL